MKIDKVKLLKAHAKGLEAQVESLSESLYILSEVLNSIAKIAGYYDCPLTAGPDACMKRNGDRTAKQNREICATCWIELETKRIKRNRNRRKK